MPTYVNGLHDPWSRAHGSVVNITELCIHFQQEIPHERPVEFTSIIHVHVVNVLRPHVQVRRLSSCINQSIVRVTIEHNEDDLYFKYFIFDVFKNRLWRRPISI